MSPHVGNFVSDLVEMAKAMEILPQVQTELASTRADNDTLHAAVQAREEAIARYKSEIEALNAKVRATEVERDDAELRFLELDEKAHSAVALARAMQDHLGQVVTKLDPPKPVPEPEPTPQAHESTDPMPTPATDLITPYLPPSPPVAEVVHSLDPISPTTDGTGPVLGSDAPASDTGSGGTPAPEWVSVPSTPTPAPSDPIGTGMGNVASSSEPNPTTPPSSDGTGLGGSDPEPTKFTTRDDGTPSTTITQSWWDWYDRQSYEFRQAYRF